MKRGFCRLSDSLRYACVHLYQFDPSSVNSFGDACALVDFPNVYSFFFLYNHRVASDARIRDGFLRQRQHRIPVAKDGTEGDGDEPTRDKESTVKHETPARATR